MPTPSKNPRPRPLDALFGDSATSPIPGYIVEPALPVTTVTPPEPAPIAEAKRESIPPTRPMSGAAPPVPESEVPFPHPEPSEPPDWSPASASLPQPEPSEAQAPVSAPVLQPPPAAPMVEERLSSPEPIKLDDPRFAGLSFRIEGLYDDVKIELRDSKAVAEYCLGLLFQARQACEKRDYASAEYLVQMVDARLKRSERSRHAARSPIVWLMWLWELIVLGLSGGLIAITYVANLTLFGLPVAPEFVVLLRTMGWGALGGVIGALYNLPWFFQYREYDPAFNMSYFARPLQGLLVGTVLFLLSQAGILAGNLVLGDIKIGPIFLYVFAVLAGFKVEYVTEFLDGLMRTIFGVPQTPGGMEPPKSAK